MDMIKRKWTLTGRLPARLLLIVAVSIFVAEALVMALLSLLSPLSLGVAALLEASVLCVLLLPVLYFFLIPSAQAGCQRAQYSGGRSTGAHKG